MTIIIAADLTDGRKVMLADGLLSSNSGSIADYHCKKIEPIQVSVKQRKGLIGSAGDAGSIIPFREAIRAYMSSPVPQVEDILFRLSRGELEKDKAEHLAWMPSPDSEQQHVLVEVDGNHWPRIVKQSFWAIGAGGAEARAALLGLALKGTDETQDVTELLRSGTLQSWKPTIRDVWIAYEVACHVDNGCGGEPTLLVL